MKWKNLNIEEIQTVSGVGGSHLNTENPNVYFEVTTLDGNHSSNHRFNYTNWKDANIDRNVLLDLYNEYHDIPETYTLENEISIEVNGITRPFGYRVLDNKKNYVSKTLLELETLQKEGKIIDDGWRHMVYICPLKIKNKKIIYGELNDTFRAQLKHMGVEIDETD